MSKVSHRTRQNATAGGCFSGEGAHLSFRNMANLDALPLTPALSHWERVNCRSALENMKDFCLSGDGGSRAPSLRPMGEGRGEGDFQLRRYGLQLALRFREITSPPSV